MIGERGWPCQLGFVVSDIEEAMDHWCRALGAGPFAYIPRIAGPRFTHREEEVSLEMAVSLAYLGETQIELIQQLNDAPSPYREFLERGGSGPQHLGFWSSDPAAAEQRLMAAGYRSVFRGVGDQVGSGYYERIGTAAPMIEVSLATRAKQAAYERLRDASFEGETSAIRQYVSFADFIADV